MGIPHGGSLSKMELHFSSKWSPEVGGVPGLAQELRDVIRALGPSSSVLPSPQSGPCPHGPEWLLEL